MKLFPPVEEYDWFPSVCAGKKEESRFLLAILWQPYLRKLWSLSKVQIASLPEDEVPILWSGRFPNFYIV
jgi:hypothetical protein